MLEFSLEPGEHVAKRVRRHPIVIIVPAVGYVLLAVFPFLIGPIVSVIGSAAQSAAVALTNLISLADPWVRFAIGLWWLVLWCGFVSALTRYYLTIWIITNTRVVDIHQYGLFNRKVSSTLLARVQDVTTDVTGIFSTLFGFGTLLVQTAGAEDELKMESIQGPEHLRDFIMNEVAALRGGSGTE